MQLLGSAAKAVIPEKPYVFFLFLFLVPVLETEKKKIKKNKKGYDPPPFSTHLNETSKATLSSHVPMGTLQDHHHHHCRSTPQ